MIIVKSSIEKQTIRNLFLEHKNIFSDRVKANGKPYLKLYQPVDWFNQIEYYLNEGYTIYIIVKALDNSYEPLPITLLNISMIDDSFIYLKIKSDNDLDSLRKALMVESKKYDINTRIYCRINKVTQGAYNVI